LLTTFFLTGEVDSSLYEPNTVNFEPSWGFPLIAKLAVGGAVLALVVTLILLRIFYGLLRRMMKRRHASLFDDPLGPTA